MVQRLVHLGFEVRVELVRDDGEVLSAQLTREQVEALELQRGQIVYVRPTRQTVFAGRVSPPSVPVPRPRGRGAQR
jgi:sulfate transport system ATP-binding protein